MQRFDRRNLSRLTKSMDSFSHSKEILAKRGIYFFATGSKQPVSSLMQEERAAVRTACRKRQIEFAAGRWCARQVLAAMNMAPVSVPCGENGAPVWPDGMRGSISHCRGACCAVGVFADRYQSVGVDIERRHRPVSDHAVSLYANPDELAWMAACSSALTTHRVSVFSAKESIYKLLSPISRTPVSFVSFSILPVKVTGLFSCRMNHDINDRLITGAVLHGHLFENETLVVTAAAI
jgi:4'-phosphopantetheinyl transferase EntD